MSALVEANYHLLAVFSRLGMDGAFGEMTVREMCNKNRLDPSTFLLICGVYSRKDFIPTEEMLRDGRIEDILRYLHKSHDYYMNNALVLIASSIENLIAPCSPAQKQVIWKFFSDYKTELEKHFAYEEGEVIPYVQNLLLGKPSAVYSIDRFEENHSNIDEKLSDLKSLILKSLPEVCEDGLRVRLLNYIYALQNDLTCHTRIEDEVLVPMVRLMEHPVPHARTKVAEAPEDSANALSDREKEILASVAKGLLNKEIADRLNISLTTVISHRKNIMDKLHARSLADIIIHVVMNNLADISEL